MGSTMKLPRSGKGRLSLEVIELADQERPPMIRIPEYDERRRAHLGEAALAGMDDPDGRSALKVPVAAASMRCAAASIRRRPSARRYAPGT
jgi:hypothetical protein